MADEQDQEEGWQARDLGSGVAKVYHEAKARSILGIRVAAAWSVVMLVYAIVDMAGIAAVASPVWEFCAALGVMLLSALAMSRTPGPMLAAAFVILADLIIIAYGLPELFERGETVDIAATAIRITVAPVALSMVLNGYLGALSIQAFKLGFSPGQDWRTRVNPLMLQAVAIGACAGALALGVSVWFGAIRAGFSQPGAVFTPDDPVAKAKANREMAEGLDVAPFSEPDRDGDAQEYPESAIPIESMDGLDTLGQRAVEEAWEFAADADQRGCLLEGQGRQGRCRDERCRYWANVFVRACLTKSRKVAGYCDGVPSPIRVTPGLEWAQRQCAGRDFEPCREMLYAWQGFCHPPGTVGAAAKNEGTRKPEDPKSNVLQKSAERAAQALGERR